MYANFESLEIELGGAQLSNVEEIRTLRRAVFQLQKDVSRISSENEQIYTSLSWRVTRPLRLIRRLLIRSHK